MFFGLAKAALAAGFCMILDRCSVWPDCNKIYIASESCALGMLYVHFYQYFYFSFTFDFLLSPSTFHFFAFYFSFHFLLLLFTFDVYFPHCFYLHFYMYVLLVQCILTCNFEIPPLLFVSVSLLRMIILLHLLFTLCVERMKCKSPVC